MSAPKHLQGLFQTANKEHYCGALPDIGALEEAMNKRGRDFQRWTINVNPDFDESALRPEHYGWYVLAHLVGDQMIKDDSDQAWGFVKMS